jgi:ribulose-5-phosphate 4-epimerase/fuculose-1-phosphate aldolase
MAHHGMICCGSDLEDAYEICQQIEKAAKAAIDARLE